MRPSRHAHLQRRPELRHRLWRERDLPRQRDLYPARNRLPLNVQSRAAEAARGANPALAALGGNQGTAPCMAAPGRPT